MKPTTKFKVKGFEEKQSHPILDRSKGYTENILTPVTLSGVVASWNKSLGGGRTSDYKLVSYSDLEYFIVADSELIDLPAWKSKALVKKLIKNINDLVAVPAAVWAEMVS